MSDDGSEDDYMNDELIKQCEAAAASTKKSVSASAKISLASAETARQIAIEKRHEKEVAEQRKNNPRYRLEEGLATALPEANVGFKLLSKMGFKPGAGIGKTLSGRSDPIPLEFRQGRAGLGREAIRLQIEAERDAARARLLEKHRASGAVAINEQQYTDNIKRRTSEHRTRRDFYAAQKACFDLDSKLEIAEPFKLFFWPQRALAEKTKKDQEASEEVELSEEKEEPDEETSLDEQLEELTAYLRLQHRYCQWCGCVFDDADDLSVNCPGPSAEFHDL